MAVEMQLVESVAERELAQRIVDVLETEAAIGRRVDANFLTWSDDQIHVRIGHCWHVRTSRRWYEVTIREVDR